VRAALGLIFIVVGVVAAVVRNVEYVPGDVRGTDAFHWISGGVIVAAGIWLLVSIRYPRLRGPWR
jgi:xanthine/uracil permease